MTPEQIVLVQDSFDQLLPAAESVAREFYQHLFALDPRLRLLFADDMREQEHMLIAMINTAVNGLWFPDTLIPVLQRLGQRHVGYGVLPGDYQTLGAALMATLREHLGEQWTPEVEAAWRAAYSFIAQSMQAGVDESVVHRT